MSGLLKTQVESPKPNGYVTPPFPSLYWPFPLSEADSTADCCFLYDAGDIVRFTLLWMLIFYAVLHVVTSAYACLVQFKSWKIIWILPVFYALIGGFQAAAAGSVIGGLLAALYNSGHFHMSTWIPFAWSFICSIVLVMSGFAIQGGL